jgi:hypothetical protein
MFFKKKVKPEHAVFLRFYTEKDGSSHFNTTAVKATGTIHTERIEYANGNKEFDVTEFPNGVRQVVRTELPNGTKWFKTMTGPDMPQQIERIEYRGGELKCYENIIRPDGIVLRKVMEYSDGVRKFKVEEFPNGKKQAEHVVYPCGCHFFHYIELNAEGRAEKRDYCEKHSAKHNPNPEAVAKTKATEVAEEKFVSLREFAGQFVEAASQLSPEKKAEIRAHLLKHYGLNEKVETEEEERIFAGRNPNEVLTATKPEPKPVGNEVRINELARELEVKGKAIIDLLPGFGVTEKKTHSGSITVEVAEKVRYQLASCQREACVVKGHQKGGKKAVQVLEPTEAWKNQFMNRMFGKYPLYVHRNELLEAAQKLAEQSSETKSVALSLTSSGDTQFTQLNTGGDHPFEDIPDIGLLYASAAIICVFFSKSEAKQMMSMTLAPDGRIADATFCPYQIINGRFVWGEPGAMVFTEDTRNEYGWGQYLHLSPMTNTAQRNLRALDNVSSLGDLSGCDAKKLTEELREQSARLKNDVVAQEAALDQPNHLFFYSAVDPNGVTRFFDLMKNSDGFSIAETAAGATKLGQCVETAYEAPGGGTHHVHRLYGKVRTSTARQAIHEFANLTGLTQVTEIAKTSSPREAHPTWELIFEKLGCPATVK